jgi:hypothetical protein
MMCLFLWVMLILALFVVVVKQVVSLPGMMAHPMGHSCQQVVLLLPQAWDKPVVHQASQRQIKMNHPHCDDEDSGFFVPSITQSRLTNMQSTMDSLSLHQDHMEGQLTEILSLLQANQNTMPPWIRMGFS